MTSTAIALTPTQLAVLRCTILDDLTYKATAHRLGMSAKTVTAHVGAAYARLGVTGGTKRDAAIALGWGWPPDAEDAA